MVWDTTKFRSVLWSDESTFSVEGVLGGPVHSQPGCDPFDPKYIAIIVMFPASPIVWDYFSYYGVGDLIM